MGVTLACFVSPHGFGHAARTCAVLEVVASLLPDLHAHIFTTAPKWFFTDSLRFPFTYHDCACDVGMVQLSPLHEDVPATIARLDQFIPFDRALVHQLAEQLKHLHVRAVLCDISPLGIAVASAARLPSILLENFTWDWIYEGYAEDNPRMAEFAHYLAEVFVSATYRVQAEPMCRRVPGALTVGPISRAPRSAPSTTRRALNIAKDSRMILLTMGGVSHAHVPSTGAKSLANLTIVIPNNVPSIEWHDHVILLPWHSEFFHPDLVAAADVVIGKLGYSTLAEAYNAGTALAWLHRPQFRESAAMASFVRAYMNQVELPEHALADGTWMAAIEPLLDMPRRLPTFPPGAAPAAELVTRVLTSGN